MSKKSNGKDDGERVVRFPSSVERKKIEKQKVAAAEKRRKDEASSRAQYKPANSEPFFNFGRIPPFTRVFAISLALSYALYAFLLSPDEQMMMILKFGFVPAYFSSGLDVMPVFAPLGIFTHMFLHGSAMHAILNTMMGLVFGVFVEKSLGGRRMFIMLFVSSIAGVGLHFVLMPFSEAPLIGASSGISGLFGVVMMLLYEQRRMTLNIGFLSRFGAWGMILIWSLIMIVIGVIMPGNIAWLAHIGGFIVGAGLYDLLKRGKISF